MGPFNAIDKFSRQLKWAHPMLSASFAGSCNGPIQSHRQSHAAHSLGPSIHFGNFIYGPIRNLHLFYSMGPCGLFRSVRQNCTWAFPITTTDGVSWAQQAVSVTLQNHSGLGFYGQERHVRVPEDEEGAFNQGRPLQAHSHSRVYILRPLASISKKRGVL